MAGPAPADVSARPAHAGNDARPLRSAGQPLARNHGPQYRWPSAKPAQRVRADRSRGFSRPVAPRPPTPCAPGRDGAQSQRQAPLARRPFGPWFRASAGPAPRPALGRAVPPRPADVSALSMQGGGCRRRDGPVRGQSRLFASSGLPPDRNVLGAQSVERRPIPVRPAKFQFEPRQLCHEVKFGRPGITERDRLMTVAFIGHPDMA